MAMMILGNMTVQDAAALWDDRRGVHLKRWGETFGIRLDEFHYGHIATYEQERLAENVSYPMVWAEVKALRAPLHRVGLGEEIESHYTTPLQRVKLTDDEMRDLSPRARAYIEYLERELSILSAESDKMEGPLRKINWDGNVRERPQARDGLSGKATTRDTPSVTLDDLNASQNHAQVSFCAVRTACAFCPIDCNHDCRQHENNTQQCANRQRMLDAQQAWGKSSSRA